jgi:hypothetical protein
MASILKVDTIQDQSGNNIINESADTITIGASGDTITIPSGATLTGAGAGLVWQSVQTTGFTAVKGNAYPCNTTSAGFTVTLPATPSAGDQVQVVDYAGTFDTNSLVIDGNGEDIEGSAIDQLLTGEREGVILTYIDSTQGWIATSGINEGTDALEPNEYSIEFLVIAGGGGSSRDIGGGGGAGGYRNSFSTEASGGGGSSEASLTFNPGTVYTITVGAGGASVTSGISNNGSNSEISGTGLSTITSVGGGGGGSRETFNGNNGGSGGGSPYNTGLTGGTGTANQGFNGGGNALSNAPAAGGGGASAVGSDNAVGTGGAGLASSITGSSVNRGGGGGGGAGLGSAGGASDGGGAGGAGGANGTNGSANTGGGAGGGGNNSTSGSSGGSGVIILRMPTAKYSATTTGSPTVTTDGTDTILVYNASGSITG